MASDYSVIFSSLTLLVYVKEHNIFSKFQKAVRHLKADIRYPSLQVELMEPKQDGIYSFRVDKKYRGLFFFNKNGEIEVFAITNHYK